MPRGSPKACLEHSRYGNAKKRIPLDSMMHKLPDNQSGFGRHKCPYCAYEAGRERGYKDAIRDARELIGGLVE